MRVPALMNVAMVYLGVTGIHTHRGGAADGTGTAVPSGGRGQSGAGGRGRVGAGGSAGAGAVKARAVREVVR